MRMFTAVNGYWNREDVRRVNHERQNQRDSFPTRIFSAESPRRLRSLPHVEGHFRFPGWSLISVLSSDLWSLLRLMVGRPFTSLDPFSPSTMLTYRQNIFENSKTSSFVVQRERGSTGEGNDEYGSSEGTGETRRWSLIFKPVCSLISRWWIKRLVRRSPRRRKSTKNTRRNSNETAQRYTVDVKEYRQLIILEILAASAKLPERQEEHFKV